MGFLSEVRYKRVLPVAGFLVLLVLLPLLLRNFILDYYIGRVQDKMKQRYHVELTVGDAGFDELDAVFLKDVLLVPEGKDTLLRISALWAEVSFLKLLKLRPGLSKLRIDTSEIHLVRRDSSDNFQFIFKSSTDHDSSALRGADDFSYRKKFVALMQKVNDFFDEEIVIRQLMLTYSEGGKSEFFSVPELYFDGENLKSSLVTSSSDGVGVWYLKGRVDHYSDDYSFSIVRQGEQAVSLPFIGFFDDARLSFDSVNLQFTASYSRDVAGIEGGFHLYGCSVNHWRISNKEVRFPNMQLKVDGFVADDSLGLGSGTMVRIRDLPVNLIMTYFRKPEKRLKLNAGFLIDDAQRLFDALPEGIFHSLRGFRAGGELDYRVGFDLHFDKPELTVFDPVMKERNFRIISYGTDNFSRIALPFSFICMDGERPVRSFQVGPENPFFTPLEAISPYLQNAVLTAEDPSFFRHSGFLEEAFRESIITNIKKKRFARGGSTISMQLVKNVFLSRNKSISRKLEEIMIVWIMEQKRLVSKERMFEVYLNIIEWGPDVYGIGEASRFYFGKSPAQLNLTESVFLSSLIPNPKYFKYRFDKEGRLKPFMVDYFKLISGRMARRELIGQADADSLLPEVQLKGRALEFIQPSDTLPPDLPEDELLPVIDEK